MFIDELLGLLMGVGTLAAVVGYLADVYFHPQRFSWLELPKTERRSDFAKPFLPQCGPRGRGTTAAEAAGRLPAGEGRDALDAQGIKPITGPGVDDGRQFFFRREVSASIS